MKKLAWAFAVIVLFACGSSKKKAEGSSDQAGLEQRLTEYIKLTDDMNLEKVMDYIYPKLFDEAPREQVLEAMKAAFDSDEFQAELDSVRVVKIYPVFTTKKGSYAKVSYSMIMLMSFSSEGEDNSEQMNLIIESLSDKYGRENLSVENKKLKIRQSNYLVAAKDDHAKEWSFVSYKEGDPMMSQLFDKEVLDKLATSN